MVQKLCRHNAHEEEFVGYFEWDQTCQLKLDNETLHARSGNEDMSSICGREIRVSDGDAAYRCILQGPIKIHRGQVRERVREEGRADDDSERDHWVTGREMGGYSARCPGVCTRTLTQCRSVPQRARACFPPMSCGV